MSGHAVVLSDGWNMGSGGNLAWSPDGSEVWFCAERFWGMYCLRAVSLEGKTRTVFQGPTSLALWDISREGRVLLSIDVLRTDVWGCAPGDTTEHSWSWLDGGIAVGVSADGNGLLFTECASGGGVGYSAYFRRFDGSLPIRIGDGVATALSLDGKWAILRSSSHPALTLTPTGPGEPRTLPSGSIVRLADAKFFPDAQRILISGNEAGRPRRIFVQDVGGGDPRPFSEEGTTVSPGGMSFSPDGTQVLAIADGKPALIPAIGGRAQPIDGLMSHEQPIAWSQDGKSLFVVESRGRAMRVIRFDMESHNRTLWKELRPRDPAGALVLYNFPIAKDGEVYFYTVARTLQELVLAEGLR
jgi:dipeptidyl aminopeptidase/acylaminoacyl peptidase